MLYLWMPEANGDWYWSRGEHWMQASSLEHLTQELQLDKGIETIVFFPSREVQLLQQSLSKSQYKQLGPTGIRYLLEEYIISSIDQMKVFSHFQSPDQVTVLGISQHAVTTMQHSLSLLPIKVVALLPDYLILPAPTTDQVVLANIHGRLLVRETEYQGNSIDDLALTLELLDHDKTILYSALSDEQFESLAATTTAESRQSFEYVFDANKRLKQHVFNVLPKQKDQDTKWSAYWKASAALFLLLLLAQFSYDALRWVKLKKLSDETSVMALDQYRSWFGESRSVNEDNLKEQFGKKLTQSQNANTQALQLISRVGPILMQQKITANRVVYDGTALNMDLVGHSSDTLQALVQQLNQQGFKAKLGNIQTQGESVVGVVNIQ
ncbi:type II secretion system protein GspL [Acinetobacter rudis]|uniref:Type II secretion system protein L n=1 Tax=Acinetobacter rudis CIP 110305 TaxID=421052 RepID=S3MYG0_9GAMM|nr:type II secretion system protein GspL [Acinetobacter rudis]EPF71448.1 type II secretion system protein L [Acinetobacter rudis CIP 110305]